MEKCMNPDGETIKLTPEIQAVINSVKQGTNLTTTEVIELIVNYYFASKNLKQTSS